MPAKRLPDKARIEYLDRILKEYGCRVYKITDHAAEQDLGNWIPPRFQDGLHETYLYTAHKMNLIVRTTINAKTKVPFDEATAWVIIVDLDTREEVYYSIPMSRTSNFIDTLIMEVRIAINIVDNRPTSRWAHGYYSLGLSDPEDKRSYVWQHPYSKNKYFCETIQIPFDHRMPEKLKSAYNRRKVPQDKHAKKRVANGLEPHAARKIRRPWKQESSFV